jgi:phage protein D
MLRTPYIEVTGPDGRNLAERFADEFVGIRVTDVAIGEADEVAIMFRRRKPYLLPPEPKTQFTVKLGWTRDQALMMGSFLYERTEYSGNPEQGQEMVLICRAAEMTDAWKRSDSENFDEETGHKTYGDIFRTFAERAGVGVSLDEKIAALPLAGGYMLRWKQSAIGFISDIADDLGAVVKLQAGFLTVRPLHSMKSPSGDQLPFVLISFDPNYAFQVDLEPRYDFGEVAAGWFDPETGRSVEALKRLRLADARLQLPHTAGSQSLAEALAEASSRRVGANRANAYFEMAGNEYAVAGAPVQPEGFGPDIDDIKWVAYAVYHEAGPDRGWITTVEAELTW